MNHSPPRNHADIWLIIAVSFLLGLGALMVYSSTPFISEEAFGSANSMAIKHLVNIFCGIIIALTVYCFKPSALEKVGYPLLFVMLLLLLLVAIPGIGHVAGGARRWLVLGPVRFQPGELSKIISIIFFATYISKNSDRMQEFFKGAVKPLIIVASIAGLLLLEPDFGTSVVILLVVFCQLLLVSKIRHLLGIGLVAVFPLVMLVVMSPYRMKRVKAFMDPFQDPSGSGYQLIQSLIAVGSGGLSGAGLGEGKQKLFYLPAAHTDFIFAVISEELGFFGSLAVIIAFLIIGYRGLLITKRHLGDPFLASLSLGATLIIVLPAFLNMAVAMGLLPTKGMVLPFISYGGSGIVSYLIILAVLLKISKIRTD